MFSNLQAEMARYAITPIDISRVIHKTERSIRNKIDGQGDFTLAEVYAIRDTFFPKMNIEYLFARNSEPPQIKRESTA